LEQGANDLGPAGYDVSFGYGRVNVFGALAAANPALASTAAAPETPPVTNAVVPANSTESPAGTTAWLVVQTNGWGHVVPNLNGRPLELGKTVRLRAV